MRYFRFSCSLAALYLGSVISTMLSHDSDWHEHLLIWGSAGLLGVLAVFAFAHSNKGLIEQCLKKPDGKLILQILFWRKRSRNKVR